LQLRIILRSIALVTSFLDVILLYFNL